MHLFARFARGQFSLTRTEAFSDAVFAIIVTLLVLELKVPHLKEPGSAGELVEELLALAPKFVSWLISFIIVCKFWLNHHYLLSLARHANDGTMWLNSLFPLGQSSIPFPTALARVNIRAAFAGHALTPLCSTRLRGAGRGACPTWEML